MASSIKLTVDQTNGLAYITLSDAAVHHTIEHSDTVLVDVDEHRVAVGIELLDLDAEIPFDELTKSYHVQSDRVDLLRRIQPSINKFMVSMKEQTNAVEAVAEDVHDGELVDG